MESANTDRRRPREWSSLVAALRDPARSDFAFVPHQYVVAPPPEFARLSLSASESTPINGDAFTPLALKRDDHRPARPLCGLGALRPQANGFVALHIVALALAGVCNEWLALFPIAPNRLYNMQVDVFSSNHVHTEFFYQPCLYLGAVLGAALGGYLGDRLGRAGALELAAVPFVLGWLLHAIAYGEVTVLLGRYVLGAAVAMLSVVVPIYVAEISAARTRGRLVCMVSLVAAIGRLVYIGVGALFIYLSRQYFGFNLSEWKALALVGVVPGIVLLVLTQRLPDSPTWLVARHDDREAAFAVIYRLFSGDYDRAENEVNGLIHASVVATEKHVHHGAFFRPLWLCASLFVLRAITCMLIEPSLHSTTATNAFSVSVLGVGVTMSETMQLAVLGALLFASVIGIVCCFFVIDIHGRIMALQSGCMLVIVGCVLLVFSAYRGHDASNGMQVTDVGSAALLLITAGYELGLGLGPIVLVGELFPTRHRIRAASVVFVCDAFARLALSYALTFVRAQLAFGHVFTLTVGLVLTANVVGVFIAWFYLPETSQRSLQSIEAILSGWYPETPQQGQSRVRLGAGANSPTPYGTANNGGDDHLTI